MVQLSFSLVFRFFDPPIKQSALNFLALYNKDIFSKNEKQCVCTPGHDKTTFLQEEIVTVKYLLRFSFKVTQHFKNPI